MAARLPSPLLRLYSDRASRHHMHQQPSAGAALTEQSFKVGPVSGSQRREPEREFGHAGLEEQVLPPLRVAFAEQPHQVTAGMQAERARRAHQFQASLLGRAVSLAVVTRIAAGDQIFPGGFAGARPRDYMVEGEF